MTKRNTGAYVNMLTEKKRGIYESKKRCKVATVAPKSRGSQIYETEQEYEKNIEGNVLNRQ